MSKSIFDRNGIVRTVPLETGSRTTVCGYRRAKEKKNKHFTKSVMNDPEVIAYCLNCKRPTCSNGTCYGLVELMREKERTYEKKATR